MKREDKLMHLLALMTEAAEEQRQLIDRLGSTLTDLNEEEPPRSESGSTPAPSSEEEIPASPTEDAPRATAAGPPMDDADETEDDSFPLEPEESPQSLRARTHGFLAGLFTAWLITGSGMLLFRLARTVLRCLSNLTDLPFDVLVGLLLLSILALLLGRRTRQLASRLIDWFTHDIFPYD